ncbi:uncharacterized protein CIMG_07273 [Coccidioides immitis RS]|uniref:Complex 1 LYR protein domain-containing protein n=1 Tax=Coccidioides immitis (strain RS) TaxID=246410 RepID=J3K9Z7_COCIM|nr:uncharacterized protein CIMG_07273 [Coccidioides immitis RS]EAS31794.3 hypothetical protein CIMG_07273 [Coccidioides immitis RS]
MHFLDSVPAKRYLPQETLQIVILDRTRAMRLSGLQRQVLALYRQCLREIRKKPVGSQANFKRYARRVDGKTPRQEFQKNRDVNRKDFATIEYLLRRGQKQLEMYASPGIRNITP